ncbi:hypothetical protein LBMAG53_11670 [Planctomycetota bacterium]|nr:hypothetical protein LBMAG53_11670 [Planctomycetota bacterium]
MGTLLLLLTPLVGGLFLALVQLAIYSFLVGTNRLKADDVPFFGLLLFRGVALVFALGALGAVAMHLIR